MPPPLLVAQDSRNHVHLIIGANSVASARCTRSIEVGAHPKIIAPPDADIHHVLSKRVEEGEVEWIRKSFEEDDLRKLGRDEVDNVVDAVFVAVGGHDEQSRYEVRITGSVANTYSNPIQSHIKLL